MDYPRRRETLSIGVSHEAQARLALNAQSENLPYQDRMIDLDPDMRDACNLPPPRLTYDWRRPNERARVEYLFAQD